ncbi:MAG TPA: cation-efflux pump [Solirubrobacteraceae bacterium]|nr:cation-efflux pump [Solirubrobacteraceae bacterium]
MASSDALESVGRGQQRVALASVVAAAVLVAVKLAAGIASGSLGLVAEALHSGTDLVAALLTLLALRVAVRPPDRDHPWGHGKAEHLAALAEAAFLAAASVFIAYHASRRLVSGEMGDVRAEWYALAVLAFVIVVDFARAFASWRAARRYSSPALASNALHFASDLLGSFAVLIGLLLVRAGYPEGDPVAALFVAVLVILAAGRLVRSNVQVLMDRAPEAAAESARQAIARMRPAVELQRLRVREAAGSYFVDVVVGVRTDAAVGQGHAAADAVEAAVRTVLPHADVVVHVEPSREGGEIRERVNAAALAVPGIREIHNVRVMTVDGRPEVSLHLKLPATLPVEEAHTLTCEVEAAIRRAVPELSDVHTHIEPLAESRGGRALPDEEVAAESDVIRGVVRELTGREAEDLRIRRRERGGLVALLTICVDPSQPLRQAHALASEVEERVRRRAPSIADVIVHTEPRADS